MAEAVELGRFVLLDRVGFNGETWFLRRALRQLGSQLPALRAVLSFSDPLRRVTAAGVEVTPGHVGQIYQALSAGYMGIGDKRRHYMARSSGMFFSPRAMQKIRAQSRGHEYATRMLLDMGAPAREVGEEPAAWLMRALHSEAFVPVQHPGNHAYVWSLHTPPRRMTREGPSRGAPPVTVVSAPASRHPYPRKQKDNHEATAS
jgi:hypothetical protein